MLGLTLIGQDSREGEAASIVKAAPLAQLLQPGQHDAAALGILEAVGRIQHISQVQQMRPCTPGRSKE